MQLLYLHAARVCVEELDLFLAAAVENDLLQFTRQLIKRRFDIETIVRRQALYHLVVVSGLAIPTADSATRQRQVGIDHHSVRVKILLDPKAVAILAGAARVIEGKQPRLELREAVAADVAGEAIGENDFLFVGVIHPGNSSDAVGETKRRFE